MVQFWLPLVQSQKAIAVIRAADLAIGIAMAKAVAAGGMKLIEVTWNSAEPVKLLYALHAELPDCWIGAGTLLDLDQLQAAIAAGADFLFTPHTRLDLIQQAVQQQVPIIPGALTPTEILTAWQAGASCVKVFPIQAVGGADYIRHLQGPLGEIPLIPTGGVTLNNARSFIDAGAVAVGLAGQLFPQQALRNQDWDLIRERASRLMQSLGG
ncbi:bifunctional 4-hydroxy-2-oxoglutarate aldolase/2-dehydro-3-deoxy-phosphogluconate aldolase [Leptolyngbya sp. NK1-12]|uniref:Bifunctional 4-hydroxy-2-oxoglutarate aldolase/2-dehydro-3-deoxy-phosphogluconate aldolase n=1 Tax=Leptolyngbya sp. NK1-12 TaxID=2547451 RepID=A0AA96WH51_9CYAN|nr:bifunctional 4-hydroxy-2-oxoglutarate aldolase/2-dehydro-3-deoxy-phosphogluconate aldolase [Leptolyngbya sp. NK1-12]WNZ25388.1 bifunctional 4-hydroxy-2-oxoglutarate aldolase/2-dehydro-3-deoxy-phosphogluconate aldolase [Leptolyngbya sp. NK1-12]